MKDNDTAKDTDTVKNIDTVKNNNAGSSKLKLWLFVLPLILLTGAVIFFMTRLNKPTQPERSMLINHPVPIFTLPNLAMVADGNTTDKQNLTNKDLPTSPYVLNVWGSWCIACSKEHPLLLKIKEKGVNIVGINYRDDAEFAYKYLTEYGDPYLFNIYDDEGSLGIDLGITGAPETFVIDSKGLIRQHLTGEITEDVLKNRLQPCLDGLSQNNTTDNEQIMALCQ